MRGDYLTRWNDLFGEGGFHRLEKDGAWFRNCNYPYAGTVTGAGHASLATGCSPWKHGVINNNWYDRDEGKVVYCATSSKWQRVPPAAGGRTAQGGTPERLLSPTLADALKEATGGKGPSYRCRPRIAAPSSPAVGNPTPVTGSKAEPVKPSPPPTIGINRTAGSMPSTRRSEPTAGSARTGCALRTRHQL